jgi:hypothetical protein
LTVDINNAIQATTANNPIATITILRIMVILLKVIWFSIWSKLIYNEFDNDIQQCKTYDCRYYIQNCKKEY